MRSSWRVRLAALHLSCVGALGAGACGGAKFAPGSDSAAGAGAAGVSGAATAGMAGTGTSGAGSAGMSGSTNGASGASGMSAAGAGGADPSAVVPKTGMLYWYAGDRGLTLSSGVVSHWADQSGNGADAAQVITGSRPKKGTFHGLPVVEFDGVDDYFVTPQVNGDFTAGVSLLALVLPNVDSPCMGIVELSNGSEIDDVSFTAQSQALAYEVLDQSFSGPLGGVAPNQVRMIEVVHSGSDASMWLDDVASTTSMIDPPVTVARVQDFVGRSLYQDCQTFSGQILEVMLYARALSTSERQTIEKYLQAKWGCCQG